MTESVKSDMDTVSREGDLKTVVIKIGTSSLINCEYSSLNLSALAGLAEAVRTLKDNGCNVVLISSGAVGVGCQRLGLEEKPKDLSKRQALAAVGQVHLMRFYEDLFSAVGLTCSQVLLTLDNLSERQQYNNAVNTFHELLEYGVVPVVNENDTVAIEQLRIGDNDTLSAQVATLVNADWLFLLTDVDALYTANPSVDPNAEPIDVVTDISQLQVKTETPGNGDGGTQWGTGGMNTKLTAANMATAGGTRMVICQADPDVVVRVVVGGEKIGTLFLPAPLPVTGGKRWILSNPVRGSIRLNDSVIENLRSGSQVSVADINEVEGNFDAGEAVAFVDEAGKELGRGLCDASCSDLAGMMDSEKNLDDVVIMEKANMCLLPSVAGSDSSASDEESYHVNQSKMVDA